jgi:hypothetical protein
MAPIAQANSQNFLNLSESGFNAFSKVPFRPKCEVADAI